MAQTFQDLYTAVREIEHLLSEAKIAHGLPDRWAFDAKSNVRIHADERYGTVTGAAKTAAEMLQSATIAEMRSRGERERDRSLSEIALKLEGWRAVLPGLAASASIELGVQTRANFAKDDPA